ncbi:MAG: LysM peptidoglycan-binding domain-containing protein [Oscillospiraceae bacterium]|nr:LysM peptidoglycan-binding domain-containing protein [Oscillospiraceae bacterium]
MADFINDNQLNAVSGGAAHANGQYWTEGGATYYRIAPNDFLGNIAALFGTSPYAIQQLNPGKIKNIDVIRAGDVIRVR